MSDASTTDQTPTEPEGITELRRSNDEGMKARRKLAFIEAGFTPADLENGPAKLAFENYRGDFTAAAVGEYLGSYGITPTPAQPAQEPAPQPTATPAEEQFFGDRQQVAGGAGGESASTPDPWVTAREQEKELLKAGASRDRTAAAVVGPLMNAAKAGDKRVLYDRDRFKARYGG